MQLSRKSCVYTIIKLYPEGTLLCFLFLLFYPEAVSASALSRYKKSSVFLTSTWIPTLWTDHNYLITPLLMGI